ncbi:MAG: hypothetical protein AAGA03_04100 [Planctomycetota bacterium]
MNPYEPPPIAKEEPVVKRPQPGAPPPGQDRIAYIAAAVFFLWSIVQWIRPYLPW